MVAERPDDGYEAAQHLANSHDCPDCRHESRLEVRWFKGAYQCWCPRCGRTDAFDKRKSTTQQWREDPDSVPIQVANKLEAKYGGQPLVAQDKAIVPIDQQERGLVQRMDEGRFLTDLKPQEKQLIAHLAVKYDLDPLFGELTWYEGKPYISVAGYERIARKSGELRGLMCLPMTREQREQWGPKYEQAAYAYICTVRVKDWPDPVYGTGLANPDNPYRNNPVEKFRPERMAKARAIRDALKQAFPHMLPSELHVAEEIERQGANVTVIDSETGEIVSGPAPQQPPADAQEGDFLDEPDADPVDAEDAPEPTALEEDEQLKAEARRKELLDWLHEFAERRYQAKWKGLLNWWGTQFLEKPEDSPIEDLEKAVALLSQKKAS